MYWRLVVSPTGLEGSDRTARYDARPITGERTAQELIKAPGGEAAGGSERSDKINWAGIAAGPKGLSSLFRS